MSHESAEYDRYQGFVERRMSPNVREFLQNTCKDTREMVRMIVNREDIPEDAFAQYSEETRKKIFDDIMKLSDEVTELDNFHKDYSEEHESTVSYDSYILSPALESFFGEMHMTPDEGLKKIYWNTDQIFKDIPQYIPQEELQRTVTKEIVRIQYRMYQNQESVDIQEKEKAYQNLRKIIVELAPEAFSQNDRERCHEALHDFGAHTYELEWLLEPFSLTRDQMVLLLLRSGDELKRYLMLHTHTESWPHISRMVRHCNANHLQFQLSRQEKIDEIRRKESSMKEAREREYDKISSRSRQGDIDLSQYTFSEKMSNFLVFHDISHSEILHRISLIYPLNFYLYRGIYRHNTDPQKIQSEVMGIVVKAVHDLQRSLKSNDLEEYTRIFQFYHTGSSRIEEVFSCEKYPFSQELDSILRDIHGMDMQHFIGIDILLNVIGKIIAHLGYDLQHIYQEPVQQLVNKIFTLQYDITRKRAQRYLY